MASFVSSRDIEAANNLKKQEKREAREAILKQAKIDHDKRKRKKELRKEKGEEDWTAPGIISRFNDEETSRKGKKRKSKHGKQKKKHSKRSKYAKSDSSSDESSDSGGEVWVEKDEPVEKPRETDNSETTITRDSWMTVPQEPSVRSLFAIEDRQSAKKKQEEKAKSSPLDNPGQHPRELNPYWKNGGSGMPEKRKKEAATRTGDGGKSWILRAYKRALEQAESEGKDLEEIAIQRWGSLDKLYSLLHAAGIDPSNPDKASGSRRREYLYAEPPRNTDRVQRHHSNRESRHKEDSRDRGEKPHSGFLIPDEAGSDTKNSRQAVTSSNWRTKSATKHSDKDVTINLHASESTHVDDLSEQVPVVREPSPKPLPPRNTGPEVTDSQLNALSAKIMKAEMLGDENKVSTLKTKLKKLRKLKAEQENQKSLSTTSAAQTSHDETAIPLVVTDRFGRMRPLDMPKGGSSGKSQRNYNPPTKKGKRKKYTDDDEDSYSLQALVEQERKMSAKDTQLAIASMASKFVSSSNTDDTIDEKHASNVAVSLDPRQNEEKEKIRAMHESKKFAEALETCKLCFGNDSFSKSLLVAVGMNVYLSVPSSRSLTDGHCFLVPMDHNTSLILLDENVWEEIKIFQKGLTRMFDDHGCDVIFTESCMSATTKKHAYLECIPLPKEEGGLAPMYFKKAILESDEEWSTNRKLIDTRQKGVRNSLPAGLPYFFVDFGLDGGFAHIIEDQTSFPSYFAKEVIGGMIDAEPRLWLKPPRDNFETQKRKVLKLSEWWKPYDWTQKLKSSK